MEADDAKRIMEKLEDIKSLLVLIANKSGASQPEIGDALGVSDCAVRRLLAGNRTEKQLKVA